MSYDELTKEQRSQVHAMFAPIFDYRLYLYELGTDGKVLCRRRA